MVGVTLFAVAAVLALVAVARRDDMQGLLVGSLTMAVAFFALPTRVHERYLFPALALPGPAGRQGGALGGPVRRPCRPCSS